jgi:TonB-dependent SusC/RagA subfamily outer membrane receptor
VSAQSPSDSSRSVPNAPLTRVPASAWGANVIVIDSAEIAKSMAQGFSELLQARRPGVIVLQSGGMASDGALVMLRGPTSLLGQSPPLVIVDGVRVDSRQSDTSLGGVSQPSRLDDILPEDIERIEILSGAAAALYGDGAANGVILVTTKSGGRGPLRFSGRATWDARRTTDEFPANYERIGVSPSTGQPVSDCSLVAVENGQCTPTGLDVWNPLEQASPFHIGNSARAHLELGGTSLGTALSFGVTGDRRQGTLPHDDGARLGARGKLSHDLPWGFGVDASGSYLRDNARLGSSLLASGLLGTAQNDANRGYDTFGALNDSLIPDQRLRHATGGIRLNWHPLDWLEAAVMSGRDRVTNDGRFDLFGPPPQTGLANSFAYEEHAVTTSNAHVGASYHVWRGVAATTGIGYGRDIVHARTTDSTVFSGLVSYAETAYHLRSTAAWINEQVTLSKELAIGAAAAEDGADEAPRAWRRRDSGQLDVSERHRVRLSLHPPLGHQQLSGIRYGLTGRRIEQQGC